MRKSNEGVKRKVVKVITMINDRVTEAQLILRDDQFSFK